MFRRFFNVLIFIVSIPIMMILIFATLLLAPVAYIVTDDAAAWDFFEMYIDSVFI